jgi:hypothetical protein
MAYSITQFENSTTASAVALDNNFTTFGALVPIPCGVAGTNALVLTQSPAGMVPTPAIAAYTNNMLFTGIAAGTNTTDTTATVGAVGALHVYKDSAAGPVLLTGGEIVQNNAFSLRYDATLNGNAGGFHLTSSTAAAATAISPSSVQINGNSTLTNLLSGNTPTITFTAAPGWSSQDQAFSVTAALASALPAVGDFMLINPPSLPNAGISYAGYVSTVASLSSVASVATIQIRQINSASASLASNSGVYRYAAIRTVP